MQSQRASNGWLFQDPEHRHALFVLQLLIATLILMGLLLYRNKDKAREFILSFLNTEFMLVLEVVAAPAPAQ